MKIPRTILIGNSDYKIIRKDWVFNKVLGGEINYDAKTIKIRKGDKGIMEDTFFHEMAHGVMKEMEYNYPQVTKYRNDDDFIQELGLTLRKTFKSLLDNQ